jgi:hypothetical protein
MAISELHQEIEAGEMGNRARPSLRLATVTATVRDSNLFQPGSSFELRAIPRNGGGSAVEMLITRNFRNGPKGTKPTEPRP